MNPNDPLMSFLAAWLGQAVMYFVAASVLFLVVWRWGKERLRGARIAQKERFDRSQWLHEVGWTLGTLLVGGITTVGLQASGKVQLVGSGEGWGPLSSIAFVLGLLALNDVWFYGVHRLLHTRWLYRHIHAIHHRSVDVNPFSSYAFHPLEAFLLSAWIFPLALLVPMPAPALAVAQVLGLANNLVSHLGYELYPRAWVRWPMFRWTTSATYHSLHHQRFHGNYGLLTRVWDRAFGTELPGYEDTFVTRGEAYSGTLPASITER